ncbi:MAG: amidohydrolase family protein [Ilumatobacteraceae bacterium]
MGPTLLIRRARIGDRLVDVRCAAGVIAAITDTSVVAAGADVTVDAGGGAVIPGLHDHHIHLLALAAAGGSLRLGPPDVDSASTFDAALRAAAATGTGWLRGVGYHENVAGPLDRHRLDGLVPHRPVRVQHRGGAMWVLNTAALDMTAIGDLTLGGVERDGAHVPTGRLFRLDNELRSRVGAATPDLAAVGGTLAGYGVTGVCDMTPTDDGSDVELLAAAVRTGALPLDVVVTGGLDLPADAAAALARGPVKFVLDDHDLPTPDALAVRFRAARVAGRPIAVHCVTRGELVVALAALDEVGSRPGDRIEHGAVIPVELASELRERSLVVVTQPSFVAERGDQYLADVEADDVPHLWRCGSLLAAGVGVGVGTDAPFGHPDPWRTIAAARDRTTPSGAVLGPSERITAARALDMFLAPLDDPAGPPRRVVVGAAADLCVLTQPLAEALRDPVRAERLATVRRGVDLAGPSSPTTRR